MKDYNSPKATSSKKFFWFLAGADPYLLSKSTYADQVKYSGLGGFVLVTTILAFISSFYAIDKVFSSRIIALIISVIWAFAVYNMERYIVACLTSNPTDQNDWIKYTPRIVLAVFLGIVISTPLELKVFETEIKKQFDLITADEVIMESERLKNHRKSEMVLLENQKDELLKDIEDRIKPMKQDFNDRISFEIQNGGCKGKCTEFKKRLKDLESEENEISLMLTRYRDSIKSIISDRERRLTTFEENYSDKIGIVDSLRALHAYPGSKIPSLVMMLLLMAIEISPVLFKMMSRKQLTPYDYYKSSLEQIMLAQNNIDFRKGYYKSEDDGKHWDKVIYHDAEKILQTIKHSKEVTQSTSTLNGYTINYK